MVLLSFSDAKHVPLILNGMKAQTTRKPRKNPIKEGDILHVYFKSRMAKDCKNCIKQTCNFEGHKLPRDTPGLIAQRCGAHTNYFGTATAIIVEDFDPLLLSPAALEAWAQADGFQNFEKANEWFTKVHGKDWIYKPWVIIYFKGDWLKEA